jgi:NADH dehydrogenase
VLVEAGDQVLPSFPQKLSEAAERSLDQLGVDVRLEAPVSDVGDGFVCCGSDLVFANTVIWAAGVKASPVAEWLKADRDRAGRIFVDNDLRVPGLRNVFAIGDTACASGGIGRALPAVAPVAKQQGRFVSDLILKGRPRDFIYRDYGNLATIGRSEAVIDMGAVRFSGTLAWLIWSMAHIWFLIGFRSRMAVTIKWLWSYLTYQRSARLITGEIASPRPQSRAPSFERKCA